MRYCLTCHHLSGRGPLCTHCGRSFGGRLCHNKKGRHLNPPDANFCGQCGTTHLCDATSSLPLGWVSRLLLLLVVGGMAWLLWRGGTPLQSLPGGWSFRALTGYRSPLVWAIEKSAHLLILLLVFYFLSAFMPGEAGRQFRSVVTSFLHSLLQLFFKGLGQMMSGVLKLLFGWIGRGVKGQKN